MPWTCAGGKRAATSETFSLHGPIPRSLFGAPPPAPGRQGCTCMFCAGLRWCLVGFVVSGGGGGVVCMTCMSSTCSWSLEARGCMAHWEICGCSTQERPPGLHPWQRDRRPVSARCTPAQCSLTAACSSAAAAARQDRCAAPLTHADLAEAICAYA